MPELLELIAEANRQLTICNACRYCEGYCAVFPAVERRSIINQGDLAFLADLCHDCQACYQACMYAPPHEFAVDIPKLLGEARAASYRRYAWPGALAGLLAHPWWSAAGASLLVALLALVAVAVHAGLGGMVEAQTGPGAFYRLIAYGVMLTAALSISAAALVLLVGGFLRLWRDVGGRGPELLDPKLWAAALWDAAALRYLSGGGGGCYHPDPARPSSMRRVLHQVLVAGIALSFAATVAAAVEQNVLGRLPPYPLASAPVLLGVAGGLGLVMGGAGLLMLEQRQRTMGRDSGSPVTQAMDIAFLALVEVVAVTGLLLLVLRSTELMGPLLVLHLGAVGGLFATAPYGKFVHAVHRLAALLRYEAESRT